MTNFIDRVAVLLKAFVTYAVLVSGALSAAVGSLQASDVPGAAQAASWVALVIAWITAAVSIVRRVTPVTDDLKGLLLPKDEDFYATVDDYDEFWDEP